MVDDRKPQLIFILNQLIFILTPYVKRGLEADMLKMAHKILAPLMVGLTLAGPFMVNSAQADWRGNHGYNSGWNNAGPALAGGLVAGLALGVLAAQSHRPQQHYPAYAYRPHHYPPRYVQCQLIQRPAYDPWGHFIGYRTKRVCI